MLNTKEAYDLWSKQYDLCSNKTRDLDQQVVQEVLAPYTFSTILELGCGTGKNTQWLLHKAKSIIALDFSEQMLAIAQQKISSPKVHFQTADITQSWSVADQSIDFICCNLVLEHVQNLFPFFEQAADKLKNKGMILISELHPFKQYLGSQARFETTEGIVKLPSYTHHISDYLLSAQKNGISLLQLQEWFDEGSSTGVPRLVSFLMQKS